MAYAYIPVHSFVAVKNVVVIHPATLIPKPLLMPPRSIPINSLQEKCRNRPTHYTHSGLELPGALGGGLTPSVHVCRRSFLSENRFKILIPGQNFKHFDI